MKPIQPYNTLGIEEEDAVLRVIRNKRLSGYVASKEIGGPEVTALEYEWSRLFGVPAVACNSATSGLLAACMAIGVTFGDEVIVPCFTMSATASAAAVLGAEIVLAKVDETLCIDVYDVGSLINHNTKAVIATNMFGHPAKLHQLRDMCDAAGVYLIEDNAQAIMARENGVFTGTIGHLGVFSLNVHKHIQCGEGGVVVAHTERLLEALRGAINHGEARGLAPGLNLRMTEITAAIARAQLQKLPAIVSERQRIGNRLEAIFANSNHFKALPVRQGCEHVYYAFGFVPRITGLGLTNVPGDFPFSIGYDGYLLRIPLFRDKVNAARFKELADSCPWQIYLIETCSYDITDEHLDELII